MRFHQAEGSGMVKAVLSIMLLVVLAVVCLLSFDSHFVGVGAAIVITLVALLVPVSLFCRGRVRRR